VQARERWLKARERELSDVQYVHVVFTLPHALVPLGYRNSARLYAWLFETSAATLRDVVADPPHVRAEIAVLSILHTWGQTLVRRGVAGRSIALSNISLSAFRLCLIESHSIWWDTVERRRNV
jgi:hypothetical protein